MKININSRLFKDDPAKRFSDSFKCDPEVWRRVWQKYKFLDYTRDEAKEYLVLILKVPIHTQRFDRWVERTEIYLKAQIALKDGVQEVSSDFFGKHKDFVEKETTKNK